MLKLKELHTLEEAAEKYSGIPKTLSGDKFQWSVNERQIYNNFIDGATWMKQRMYSEEEFKQAVKDAYDNGINAGYNSPINGEQYYKEYEQRRIN
jgi:hypothetical protein